jgi:3,2-trans-enoyl-CoA isomerase
METLRIERSGELASVILCRGKVNALNPQLVHELSGALRELAQDRGVRALILTGSGPFFSFGFDIPEFLGYSKESFTRYLESFTALYTELFLFPKPVVAALNGHTIAGGFMLAMACDHRIMVTGKAKIALNEISFGSTVFAGSTEILKFWVGAAAATRILYSGGLYTAEEARALGLVHEVTAPEELAAAARTVAEELGRRDPTAFSSIKMLLRRRVAEEARRREADSIREFVEIWYSPQTWEKLQDIKIR